MWQISGLYTSTGIIPKPVYRAFANGLLTGETDGFAIDATDVSATPAYTGAPYAGYVSVKDTGTPANNLSDVNLDSSNLVQSGTSPKMVLWNSSPYVRWTPHNLFTHNSNIFSTDWSVANATITDNTDTAPDGTSTADTMTGNGGPSVHRNGTGTTITASVVYTFSVYIKAGTLNYAAINHGASTDFAAAVFDLSLGVVGETTSGGGGTLISSAIASVGNGWYRCSLTTSNTNTTSTSVQINLATAATGNSFDANGNITSTTTGTIKLWGYQHNRGPVATPYLATTSAARIGIPQEYDTAASKYGILVEPAATNIALRSDAFDNASWTKVTATITADNTTAPDGSSTADKFLEGNATNEMTAYQNCTASSGTTFTASVFVKDSNRQYFCIRMTWDSGVTTTKWAAADFDLTGGTNTQVAKGAGVTASPTATITSVGNGWYRVTLTQVFDAATTTPQIAINLSNSGTPTHDADYGFISYAGDGTHFVYVWGAQLESGPVATSYIPTLGSTVVRAVDQIETTTSSFPVGATETSILIWGKCKSVGAGETLVQVAGNSDQDSHTLYSITGPTIHLYSADNNVTQADFVAGSITVGTAFKVAGRYKANDFHAALGGTLAAAGPDTSGTYAATLTALKFGLVGQSPHYLLYQMVTLPRAYTNTELQTKTT